jgi:hypothetical protein
MATVGKIAYSGLSSEAAKKALIESAHKMKTVCSGLVETTTTHIIVEGYRQLSAEKYKVPLKFQTKENK